MLAAVLGDACESEPTCAGTGAKAVTPRPPLDTDTKIAASENFMLQIIVIYCTTWLFLVDRYKQYQPGQQVNVMWAWAMMLLPIAWLGSGVLLSVRKLPRAHLAAAAAWLSPQPSHSSFRLL